MIDYNSESYPTGTPVSFFKLLLIIFAIIWCIFDLLIIYAIVINQYFVIAPAYLTFVVLNFVISGLLFGDYSIIYDVNFLLLLLIGPLFPPFYIIETLC